MRCFTSILLRATAVGLVLDGLACGPSAPPPSSPGAASQATAGPTAPPKKTRFLLAIGGRPAGTETWTETVAPDGSELIEFSANVDAPGGARIHGEGAYSVTATHVPDSAEVTIETPKDGASSFRLSRSGGDLVMSMDRGDGHDDVLKAGRPSNVFAPRPFFVGFAPVCALLASKDPPGLVEFPGSPIAVLGRKEVAGALVYSLDHGGLGRTLLACDGPTLVAVLDPWIGESAVRDGREEVGKALLKSSERTKPSTPEDLAEEEVSVPVPGADGDAPAELACSFMRPRAGAPKLPAVVFATGSGPEDRDDDSPGQGGLKLSVFKEMAIALAKKGIASMRCDDRGTAKSTGSFTAATLATFVRDGTETLAAVSRRKDVDPTRIALIGHSEGAIIGTLVALKAPKTRALVLMASPGRPLPEIGMIQEETFLNKSGLPPDQIKRQLEAQRDVLQAIREAKPLPERVPDVQKEIIEKQRAWLKSHFDNDITAALKRLPKMPVLVAQGGKDIQVPPDEAARVQKALAEGKNGDAAVKTYPELNHVFATSHGAGVTEYADPEARVDASFLADTAEFLSRALAAR